jgi:glucose-6-phosphate 1-dehydrogenase
MNRPPATLMIIFGGSGDLARRKLMPALYNLYVDKWMPESFEILGIGRSTTSDDQYRRQIRDGIGRFSRSGKPQDEPWRAFADRIFFLAGDPADATLYSSIRDRLAALAKEWNLTPHCVFYLAVPPTLFEPISRNLGQAGLLTGETARLVIEKPFGQDLESAQRLNRMLAETVNESQVYRIDHYLGKETVQNILALRFANSLFEPIWNRRYIDHVQITVAEKLGVEQRGQYYEGAGALRDMAQNHLLQVLCHIAMEPPVTYDANEIRNKKVDVLHAVRRILPKDVSAVAVRGQYVSGMVDEQSALSYREEPDVARDSRTETFAALKLFVDNWRWQDVPFYLRTGKRMPMRVSEVCIQFRPVPHQSFPISADGPLLPNCLFIRLLPDEGIVLRLQAKQPGHRLQLHPIHMRFAYQDVFHAPARDAYETLLRDAMLADGTLFMRADQVEAAWSVVEPVLNAWKTAVDAEFPSYPAGTWGPEPANELLARDGRSWICSASPSGAVDVVGCEP